MGFKKKTQTKWVLLSFLQTHFQLIYHPCFQTIYHQLFAWSPLSPLLHPHLPRHLSLLTDLPDLRPLLPNPRSEAKALARLCGLQSTLRLLRRVLDLRFELRYVGSCKEIFKRWKCISSGKPNARNLIKWWWKPEACDLLAFDSR